MAVSDPLLVTWVAPDGTEFPLNDRSVGRVITAAVQGLGMPPIVSSSRPVFDRDGEIRTMMRYGKRTITIPLAVVADTPVALDSAVQSLVFGIAPKRGDGMLRFQRGERERQITCRYAKGMEGAHETDPWGGVHWDERVLDFECLDPFFTDAADIDVTLRTSGGDAFFPVVLSQGPRLGSSSVFQTFEIQNGGDIESFPVITISGPCVDPSIENLTTGERLDLSANGGVTLDADGTITIDCRNFTVRKADGTNLFSKLTNGSSVVWPITRGMNEIKVNVSGADERTSVRFTYRRNWLTF